MKQMTFESMQEEAVWSAVNLEEADENELVIHMANAIIEVLQNQGEKTDDKISDQP